jgi:hypothetical protein
MLKRILVAAMLLILLAAGIYFSRDLRCDGGPDGPRIGGMVIVGC